MKKCDFRRIRDLFDEFAWGDYDPDFSSSFALISLSWLPAAGAAMVSGGVINIIMTVIVWMVSIMIFALAVTALKEKYKIKSKTAKWLFISLQSIYSISLIILYTIKCVNSAISVYILIVVSVLFSMLSVRLFIRKIEGI
ncbi:MAG: hypothetical protein LBG17_07210 [Bacteroidales bacterium]|jgi:hypothetical protein|nr:hypothetical protein [Bacteroidales bacterium]